MAAIDLSVVVAGGGLIGLVAGAIWTKATRSGGKGGPDRVFVDDKAEFLSIWAIAHAWEGQDSKATQPDNVPAEIRRRIDKVILAYFRGELQLRKQDGYRVVGHRLHEKLLGLDKEFEKLWDCLTKSAVDADLLDHLYVRRTEILRWCPTEYMDPPPCWAPPQAPSAPEADEDDEADGWYEQLTSQRRRKVACLELARHIWATFGPLPYEAVRTHPLMRQAGLHNVFNPNTFKKWSRDFAPEETKQGGRRPNSAT